MTETPDDLGTSQQPAAPQQDSGNGCRACGLGCLGIVILTGLALGVGSANAAATLDARYSQAAQEIATNQQNADVRRATVVGAPENDTNALAEYNGIQWVLAGGNVQNSMPKSWKTQRPELPDDVDEMTALVSPDGKQVDLVMTGTLLRGIRPDLPEPPEGTELSKSEQKNFDTGLKAYEQAKPVLRYVRDGLQRGKADWKLQWEKGFRFEIPNLLHMRGVANLMAYEASLGDPKTGIQTGLEIVAFGQDLARQESLIGAMIGIAVSQIGFQSLAHTLGRPGIDANDCRRVITALGTYRAPPADQLLAGEKLVAVVTALEMSGRRLDKDQGTQTSADELGVGVIGKLDLFHARELGGYEVFMDRAIEITRLPLDQRDAAQTALQAELEDSYYFVAKIAIPNTVAATRNLRESEAMAGIVRVLAAAQLHRLEQGEFPGVIEDLEGLLGKGIQDPTNKVASAPLGYAREEGIVRCWLVGENGVDDGGPIVHVYKVKTKKGKKKKKKKKKKGGKRASTRQTDDRGLFTRAPAPKKE